jgi:hypothetical protein
MGKYKENPKYNVLSIRITYDELEAFASESHTTNRTISDLMWEVHNKIVPSPASCYDNYDRGGRTV